MQRQKQYVSLEQFYFLLIVLCFIIFSSVTAKESEINSKISLKETNVTTTKNKIETTPPAKTVVTRGRRQNCGTNGLCGALCCAQSAPPEIYQSPSPLLLQTPQQQIQSCVCTPVQQDSCCALQQQPQQHQQQQQQQKYLSSLQQSQSNFNDPCCIQNAPSPLPPSQPKLACICTPIQQDPCCNMQHEPSPPPPPPSLPCECLELTLRIQPQCNCPPPIVQNQPQSPPSSQPVCVCTPVQQDSCCLAQLVQQEPPALPPSLSPQSLQQTVPICITCVQNDSPLCCNPTQMQNKPECICTSTHQDPCCPQTIQHVSPPPPPPSPQTFCICTSVQQDSCCQQYPLLSLESPQPPQQPPSQMRATCVCTAVQQDPCCSLQAPQPSQLNPSQTPCVCTPIQQDSCCPMQQSAPLQSHLPLAVQSITIQCAPLCGNVDTGSKFDAPLPHQQNFQRQPLGRQHDLSLSPLVISCTPANCQCQSGYSQCAANKCCLKFSRLAHKKLFKKLMHRYKA